MVDSTKQNVKHTPGPWEIDKSTSSQGHDIYNSGEKSELLASVYPMKHDEQYMSWKANARLIAAAPEMLAALETVQEWMSMNVNDHDEDCPCELIDAVIRKAVGDGR